MSWPTRLELVFREVHDKLSAIKGGAGYNYAATLTGVERQILEFAPDEDGDLQINSLADAPKIIILRGENIRAAAEESMDTFTRVQEFQILFKLKDRSNCEDVGKAIADMMRALFMTPWSSISREHEFARIDLSDPETQVLLPGPQITFSLVYSERIGDPNTE